MPGISDQPNFFITGYDEDTKEEITNFPKTEKLVAFGSQESSLIYVTFTAPANCRSYDLGAVANVRGLVSKQSFYTYEVTIPFSTTNSYLLSEAGLNVAPRYTDWGLFMFAPLGTELKWALPYPDSQDVWMPFTDSGTPTSVSQTSFRWNANQRNFNPNSQNEARSDAISVLLGISVDEGVQGRLFFDSGLYMGLGVSLLVGGFHELLKVYARVRGAKVIDG